MNSYYNTKGVREICHDVKNTFSNKDAILTMAEYFSGLNILDESCIIIPAPQHYGYADYTLQIAKRVSEATGAKILDVLKCQPRDMLYDLKKQGKGNTVGLYLSEDIKLSGKYFFLDNVISTGKTFQEACSVTKLNLTALVYAVDENQPHTPTHGIKSYISLCIGYPSEIPLDSRIATQGVLLPFQIRALDFNNRNAKVIE